MVSQGGQLSPVTRRVGKEHLDVLFQFVIASDPSYVNTGRAKNGTLMLVCELRKVIDLYGHWRMGQLKALACLHKVAFTTRTSREQLIEGLRMHSCEGICPRYGYVFDMLSAPRTGTHVHRGGAVQTSSAQLNLARAPLAQVQMPGNVGLGRTDDHLEAHPAEDTMSAGPEGANVIVDYLQVADTQLVCRIIEEWEDVSSTAALTNEVCAVCARGTPPLSIQYVHPDEIDMSLLQNPDLPEAVLPVSYNRQQYNEAILEVKGMTRLATRAPFKVCRECVNDLKRGKMPRYALANWLYYGHERLPPTVKAAIKTSTQMERMLTARGRSSKISFKFTELDDHEAGAPAVGNQRFVKGNVAIHPQDSTHLNNVLPPSLDAIRDTVCAVFVGRTKPSIKTIEKLRPVLVRKPVVKTIIDFLVGHNTHYNDNDPSEFGGFSQANLDALFGEGTGGVEEGVLCSMEVGHIVVNDAVEGATEGYVPDPVGRPDGGDDDMLIENVGYTDGDDSPIDFPDMARRALEHCLAGGKFIKSQAASRLILDFENPSLLSWLFPHLDPWGIGSFYEPRRKRPLSLNEQLKYLLSVDGSPFKDDPDFAFVYYNIRQKRAVFDSVTFRVKASQREWVVSELMSLDPKVLEAMTEKFKRNPHYKPKDPGEVRVVKLLQQVTTASHDLPGSNGYKLSLRNQIRSLITYEGTPTLFITLNPSDRDHPLVRLYAGHDIQVEDHMRGEDLPRWKRSILAARNPAACAKFFDTMITNFIKVILRHKREGRGLFGKCKGYYGTVEAQGRGTLHCHMLVWLEGHPSPQKLRDNVASSDSYRDQLFKWVESIVKCELPGTDTVVTEPAGMPLPRPRRSAESGNPHPGAIPAPSLRAFERHEEFEAAFNAYVTDIVKEYNWHEHNQTCFKYVAKGIVPEDPALRDALCRMRIDGHTRAATEIDPDTGSLLLRRLHPRIANFNDVVVFLLKCNMDIKHIGSGEAAEAVVYYITDYITKASLPAHVGLAVLSYAIQRTQEKFPGVIEEMASRGALTLTVNRMISQQEISHQQVMSYLVGGGDTYTSHTFKILYWVSFDRMFRTHFKENWSERRRGPVGNAHDRAPDGEALDEEGLQDNDETATGNLAIQEPLEGDEDSFVLTMQPGSISASNQQQDYIYRNTDPEFESMSLYEFTGMVEKTSLRYLSRRRGDIEDTEDPVDGDENVVEATAEAQRRGGGRPAEPRGRFSSRSHTQYGTHFLRKRSTWTVPVIIGSKAPRSEGSPEERDLWARMMVILFVPWRKPSDVRRTDETWTEAFARLRARISPKNMEIINNMNVLSECRDARDTHRDLRRAQALALMRGGRLSSEQEQSGESSDGEDHFDLFERPDAFDLYEDVNNSIPSEEALKSVIGDKARRILDLCYSGGGAGPDAPNGDVQMRAVEEEDEPTFLHQRATMRVLKRQRRPKTTGDDVNDPRPRKRTRYGEQLEEMTVGTLRDNRVRNLDGPRRDEDPTSDIGALIDQVVEDMALEANPEQERAFRIVADHMRDPERVEQLLMYIAGVGGTGKTHVIKAMLRLFSLSGRRGEILVAAPTGAAALNVDGYTIHSLLMMPAKLRGKSLSELVKLWRNVRYLVIDEVSMIGAAFLADICHRLQQAKGECGVAALRPFGGVNIIFTGDFGQLKPVLAKSLFDHHCINHPGLQMIREHTGIDNLTGVYLWRQVETVVKLTKNQRQSADPTYAEMLGRIQLGLGRADPDPVSGEASDVDILHRRMLAQVAEDNPGSLTKFRDAPVIVGTKALRDALNARIIYQKAKEAGQTVETFYAKDKYCRVQVSGDFQKAVWKLPTKTTQDALGMLPMFSGMKVMLRENIAFGNRLVNGAEGTVVNVVYEVVEGKKYASVAYIRVPGAGKVCENLEEDVVPIFPETFSFKVQISVNGKSVKRTISRTQLPLIPAYAYTDYKSQGKSLTHAIVDLDSAMSLQGVYVMLSRVKTLNGLLILRGFSSSKLCGRMSQELRDELARIDRLSEHTLRRWEKSRHLGGRVGSRSV